MGWAGLGWAVFQLDELNYANNSQVCLLFALSGFMQCQNGHREAWRVKLDHKKMHVVSGSGDVNMAV